DLGLVTALPVTFWAALAVLTAGFAAIIAGRARIGTALPAGYVLTLIAALHATPALLYPNLRYAWAWKHVSIVEVLTARHSLPNVPDSTSLAAYSQWPGFFTLNTLLTQMTGASSAGSYAAWGPPLFNAAMIVPLVLLYRSITGSRRLLWCGVWVYFISSWVGQDYFSPQAYSFVLYVLFLAVVVRRIGRPAAAGSSATPPWGELGLLLLIAAAIDSSHQLTPVMLVTVLAALMIKRSRRKALLPLFCGVVLVTAAWEATVGRPFLAAHLSTLVKAIGSLDANTGSAFVTLSAVSRDQALIAWIDRGLTAGMGLLGVVALLRRPRLRSPLGWLALSPLVLLGMSDYGGEIAFRVYLFALPALALLVAGLLLPASAGRRALRSVAARARAATRPAVLAVAFTALLSALIFAYYGKERGTSFTADEVAAAAYVAAHTKPGEVIIGVNDDYPGAYTDYPDHSYVWFGLQDPDLAKRVTADPVGQLGTLATISPDLAGYIVLTRSQDVVARQTGALPPGAFEQIRGALDASPATPLVFGSPDARVYRIDLQSIAAPSRGGPS
ncbi:MAG: glycosyltransferase, partial [Catenulispora sp.]